jgi:hypothetical protein
MDRLVLVVSRERDDVYESLKDVLASETDVAVVLDRRVTHRRQQTLPAPRERRHVERRAGDHATARY